MVSSVSIQLVFPGLRWPKRKATGTCGEIRPGQGCVPVCRSRLEVQVDGHPSNSKETLLRFPVQEVLEQKKKMFANNNEIRR